MPVSSHANGMPVTWQADPRRKVPRVVLGSPDAIFRHLERCEPKPLRARSAVNIPVEPGVVDKNLQATADQKDDEKEIDVVGETKPCWKPLWSHSFDENLRTRRQWGEPSSNQWQETDKDGRN